MAESDAPAAPSHVENTGEAAQPLPAAEIERLIRAALAQDGIVAARAVVDRYDAPFLSGPGGVEEVCRRVQDFAALCQDEVTPRVARLHDGLARIAAPGGDPDGIAWRARARAYWPQLRAEVTALLHIAWLKAHRAAGLYVRLPTGQQAEVERRCGPVSDGPGQFSVLWHTHWPTRELAQADQRAHELGIVTPARQPATPARAAGRPAHHAA